HTIRALLIAAFAEGESRLRRPLVSKDAMSCRKAVEALGAVVRADGEDWIVKGFGGRLAGGRPGGSPGASSESFSTPITIDVGNSGTTLYLTAALAALTGRPVRFDGDEQIRRRSAAPLLKALEAMGANVKSAPDGCAPFTVTGPLKTGEVTVDCPVSQYLSALLLAAPLISGRGRAVSDGAALPAQDSEGGPEPTKRAASTAALSEVTQINVRTLNEAPYVGITLDWLEGQGIRYERKNWEEFRIPAGQYYRPFEKVVPADWSSATFFLVAAAVTGGTLVLEGLDTGDSQGDKAVVGMLEAMGCKSQEVPGGLRFFGRPLSGAMLDLNATPDALPAMAVAGCFAQGETRLVNVPQARLKETDRITVMTTELMKLGADVEELPDGMVIRGRRPSQESCVSPVLKGALVDGHDDHRVVMALAVAALGCCGQVSIRGAEAADITFPGFFKLLDKALGRNGN
ncbi:MAG: 3-phosphoshikimate 1-carboxyvinyltransferase, partial [Spirochaetaceae bacterium]|nr:3-phosphoshikimate 1-carboxyvinyltransferase [Spirochaetaceae bacterium]